MNVEQLIADLQVDEGIRLMPYRDSVGKLTIGVGRNIEDRGITEREAGVMLATDIKIATDDLNRNAPWWRELPEPAQRALANMCFNLGWPRLSKFQNMLKALHDRDYERAAVEAFDSRWALQVGDGPGRREDRADRIAALFRSCV